MLIMTMLRTLIRLIAIKADSTIMLPKTIIRFIMKLLTKLISPFIASPIFAPAARTHKYLCAVVSDTFNVVMSIILLFGFVNTNF